MSERELLLIRLRFLDLLKSFYDREPDAEKLGRWRGTFAALAREQINPVIDSSVKECSGFLHSKRLRDLQAEYYRLFTDPFSAGKIHVTASYYLDGQNFGQTLVSLRSFLHEARLVKEAGVQESEDSLVVLLDALVSLVEEEKETGSSRIRAFQARLLEEYLTPFVRNFCTAMEAHENVPFYTSCGRFLGGYLDLELGLSHEDRHVLEKRRGRQGLWREARSESSLR